LLAVFITIVCEIISQLFFIGAEAEIIKKILKHLGLWEVKRKPRLKKKNLDSGLTLSHHNVRIFCFGKKLSNLNLCGYFTLILILDRGRARLFR